MNHTRLKYQQILRSLQLTWLRNDHDVGLTINRLTSTMGGEETAEH